VPKPLLPSCHPSGAEANIGWTTIGCGSVYCTVRTSPPGDRSLRQQTPSARPRIHFTQSPSGPLTVSSLPWPMAGFASTLRWQPPHASLTSVFLTSLPSRTMTPELSLSGQSWFQRRFIFHTTGPHSFRPQFAACRLNY
jgi:hypothetical protein